MAQEGYKNSRLEMVINLALDCLLSAFLQPFISPFRNRRS